MGRTRRRAACEAGTATRRPLAADLPGERGGEASIRTFPASGDVKLVIAVRFGPTPRPLAADLPAERGGEASIPTSPASGEVKLPLFDGHRLREVAGLVHVLA